ncbi:MAG: Crp/Fnr family transcriptional regulator [Sulfurovum sp.]|nr:Crp/Fnr family transcriptional regulator [Sulfurovum sp.]MCB4760135.1 Crp/Fnr family transcriptional regulator [Sulfurovum sp.]MCB4763920.1 Crp/Fnr family transcriptional regulator [Sulfurovum sp.]MCB4778887.1 Crp/Fnr family transcriptional regulator [Sulfurovum sp.]MCB4784318.1 Crp/Fnr family transcriptional regulator [Sulfurovum sp.]
MQFLRQYIELMIEIDDDEWQMVQALFTKKAYKKGEELFCAGKICQELLYVSSGTLRAYSITTEGKELTWMVNHKKGDYQLDPFSGDYVSFLTQEESMFFIEALEDTTVYIADFNALDRLYESNIKWMTLAKRISDRQVVTIATRAQMMKQLTAKEKYTLMKKIAPIYEEMLPDYQYATVLGITPQSLSRIKNG